MMKKIYYYSEEEIKKKNDKGINEYEGEIEEFCQDESLFPVISEIIDTDFFNIPVVKLA